MKTVGILGGFGPETTAEFYISIINKNRGLKRLSHPNILIHNAPVPFKLEEDAVKNAKNIDKVLPFLINGIRDLQDKVEFIVIPCNTVHIFIKELRKESKVPVISIIEETVNKIKSKQFKRVGLLATPKTIKERLFDEKLREIGVKLVRPNKIEQKRTSKLIQWLLKGHKTAKMNLEFSKVVKNLQKAGVEAIILGCTDLQLLNRNGFSIELIDTLDVLADSTVKALVN